LATLGCFIEFLISNVSNLPHIFIFSILFFSVGPP
jgi:hypothetical protein